MKTFVLEPMPDLFWKEIKHNNWQTYFTDIKKKSEIVIIRTQTQFDKKMYHEFPKMKMIIRAGSGFDNVDISEAKKHNIIVCNTPNANAYSAYEHTLSFIFALIKQHQESKDQILKGNWKHKLRSNWEISDLKILVVGVGRVGTLVCDTLKSLGAEVRGVDPYLTVSDWEKKNVDKTTFKEGLKWCNTISFHCPLTKETHSYFNIEVMNKLKNPIWLINTSRGKVVDESAVIEGLNSTKLLGFATDVFIQEPWQIKDYANNSNVIVTPHMGAYTKKAKDRMSLETIDVWSNYVFNQKIVSEVDERFIF